MRVGIIGAGVAGLTTAKVLKQAGHDVVVYDKAPDVGGVWSRTRRYPGLTTQSPKAQYSLSDFPMPRDYPEWPTGAQVQAYLAAYASHFGLDPALRLSHRGDIGRSGTRRRLGGHRRRDAPSTFDTLVVANGVFCEPAVPRYPGEAEFTAAGGQVLAGTELHDEEQARGKRVLVVGYGKSACDVTVPVSEVAASTDVIARHLLWKVPRRIGGFLNFKMLLLTRMGEALFKYLRPRGVEKFLHGPANGMRGNMINSIGSASVRQFGLKRLGLVPPGQMEDIVRGAIGLATEGFFEGVAAGRIVVHPNRTIARLLADDGKPAAELDDGTRLPADLIVCATGFIQGVPFLPADVTGVCSTSAAISCSTGRSARWTCPACTSTGTTPRSSARSTPRWPRSGSPRTWRARSRCPSRPRCASRSSSSSRSWTSPPTPTTAAAGRSSRSRCTTWMRCSAISASISAPRSARGTGSCRSTPRHTAASPPRSSAACRAPGRRRPLLNRCPARRTPGKADSSRSRFPGRRSHCPF